MTRARYGAHPARPWALAIVAALLAAVAGLVAAQIPGVPPVSAPARAVPAAPISALAEIDRLAIRAVALVRGTVPDSAGTTIWVLPFTTDTGTATRLGHRLQSAVHLRLLRDYRTAQIRVAPRRPLPAPAAAAEPPLPADAVSARHALELEIQPFRDTLRVVLRMLASGTVAAGDWIDLPVNEELWELLDGTGAGADAAPARRLAATEGPRTALPSAITVDRGQQRYTTGGVDWVTLQVAAPGFYLLEARSFSGPLRLSLHYDRTAAAVVTAREDVPAAAAGDPDGLPWAVDRMLGIFSGPRRSYARIESASGEDAAFYLRLRPLAPPRRYADRTMHAVPLDRGIGFQTLRVFRSGSYRVVAEADSGAVELRVFGVPNMRSVAADNADAHRFELPAGDYLIEVTSSPAAPAARMCWMGADTTGGCPG